MDICMLRFAIFHASVIVYNSIDFKLFLIGFLFARTLKIKETNLGKKRYQFVEKVIYFHMKYRNAILDKEIDFQCHIR